MRAAFVIQDHTGHALARVVEPERVPGAQRGKKKAHHGATEKKGEHVIVDADYVRKMLTDIVKDQDLSRYIL